MSFPDDWDEVTCISHLQRKILYYSILYYEYDISLIDDQEYDRLAHGLAKAMKECDDDNLTKYYYIFYDYEGSTGYYLVDRLTGEDKEVIMSLVMYAVRKTNY